MYSRIVLTFCLLFMVFTFSNAQTKKAPAQANQVKSAANSEITATVEQMIKALNSIYINNAERSITPVTNMLEPDFENSAVQVDVGGNPRRFHRNLEEYKLNLMRFMGIADLTIHYELESMNLIKTYENFSLANLTVKTEYKIKGEVLIKSRSFVNIYLRKKNGVWKIWELSNAEVIKEQVSGVCPCEFMRIGDGESAFKSKLLVPNGDDFATVDLDFEITPAGDMKMVKVGNNTYAWNKEKMVCVKKADQSVIEPLEGNATNSYEAMSLIITKHLYKGNCLGLRSQIKR